MDLGNVASKGLLFVGAKPESSKNYGEKYGSREGRGYR